jgi:hypothetical protein
MKNYFILFNTLKELAKQGRIKSVDEAIALVANTGEKVDGIVRKGIENIFKTIKARDPLFNKSVTKMPIDDAGVPFNPKTLKSTTEKRGVGNLFKKKADDVPWQETTAPFNPKAAAFYDDIVEESTALAKRTGKDVRSLIEERIGYKFTGNESMKEIIDIVEAKFFKADGGRIGYDIGGLTGQAKNIYDSWISAGHSSQDALDYLSSRGMYDAGGGGVENIINTQQSIIPGAGGGGGSGLTGPDSYTQTWTSEGLPAAAKTQTQPIGLTAAEQAWKEGPFYGPKQNIGMAPNTLDDSIRVQALAPADAPPGFFEGTIEGELDYTIPGTSQIFDPNTAGRKQYLTPRTIGDQVYEQSLIDKETGIKTLGVPPPRTGLMGMWDKTKDFFSGLKGSPKVRGTLGTRLANQPRFPLPASLAAYSFSPFNPDSRNYNPNFVDQLNFLEMQDNMIGRDPNSGLLKYGPESVLSGKNVISLFGTNDYEEALNKYLQRMNRYENPTKRQLERIKKAELELQALLEKEKAAAAASQPTSQPRWRTEGGGQDTPGAGGQNVTTSSGDTWGGAAAGWNEAAEKSDYYKKGGLATMFTRRR